MWLKIYTSWWKHHNPRVRCGWVPALAQILLDALFWDGWCGSHGWFLSAGLHQTQAGCDAAALQIISFCSPKSASLYLQDLSVSLNFISKHVTQHFLTLFHAFCLNFVSWLFSSAGETSTDTIQPELISFSTLGLFVCMCLYIFLDHHISKAFLKPSLYWEYFQFVCDLNPRISWPSEFNKNIYFHGLYSPWDFEHLLSGLCLCSEGVWKGG